MPIGPNFEDWETFLKHANLNVHVVDSTGKIAWVNDTELEVLGYTRDEFLGLELADIYADSKVLGHCMEVLLGGGKLTAYPAQLQAKDGSVVCVLVNSNAYAPEGDLLYTRCFSSEISPLVYEQLVAELTEKSRA